MGKPRVKPNYRRRVLRLPDLDHCKTAVLNGLVLMRMVHAVSPETFAADSFYRNPPDASRTSPVNHAEAPEARNTATGAMSSGCPNRPSGVCATICFWKSLPTIPPL